MRGVLIVKTEDKKKLYIDKFFDACWKDGLNLNDQKIVDKILEDLNFDHETFKLKISEQKISNLESQISDIGSPISKSHFQIRNIISQ